MTISTEPGGAATFHRLRSISVTGGFLDRAQFDLCDGLNCLIGPRGTGKTTALEFVRYALDAFPDAENGIEIRKKVESLVQGNLGGGRIRVAIQTKDGLEYIVSRTAGEKPMVLTADGQPTNISLSSGELFAADIYSQDQVEGIADDPLSQLALIDDFDSAAIRGIEAKIRQVESDLRANARTCIETQKTLAGLKDEIGTLPSVREKLKTFTVTTGENAEAINKAHEVKALREREHRVIDETAKFLSTYAKDIEGLVGRIGQQVDTLFGEDVLSGPNGVILKRIVEDLQRCGGDVDGLLRKAHQRIAQEQNSVQASTDILDAQHKKQELAFRELIEKHKEAQGRSAERAAWETKLNNLLNKEKLHQEHSEKLTKLKVRRAELFQTLSDLRDERFTVRKAVADRINAEVSPQIRVQVEQYGNPQPYQNLLETALRGAGIRHNVVAQKIAARVLPSDLVVAVNGNDTETLVVRAEINPDQAARVVSTLTGSEVLYEIEAVELIDLPRIELLDGQEYKDSLTLSTGQKCTSVLPILLLDSENPLLIDQPEDNLDNRFIFTTVVKRIREVKPKRQLVFVTHNPNIPVLGDAERVFVLNSSGTQAQKTREGTVDECKEEIVTLLEGGEEAFKERKKRYNY